MLVIRCVFWANFKPPHGHEAVAAYFLFTLCVNAREFNTSPVHAGGQVKIHSSSGREISQGLLGENATKKVSVPL